MGGIAVACFLESISQRARAGLHHLCRRQMQIR
jgi:hypothetical protein